MDIQSIIYFMFAAVLLALLGLVQSANVACGMHAGDPLIMARTIALAKQAGA